MHVVLIRGVDVHSDFPVWKANAIVVALSRKEREPPLRVRALVMTIGLDLPRQILNAQTEARKPENIKKEDVGGMLVENSRDPEKSGQEIGTIISAWLSSPTTTVDMLASSVPLLRCCMVKNAVLRYVGIRLENVLLKD
nr:reverse transcriptase domain-containing protein [Tanacetum cinerariifolium]